MSHIVESCPLTKLNGGLSRLHSADEDAVSWLTIYIIMVNDTHTRRRLKALMYGSHSFTCTLHHTRLHLVSLHQMAPPLTDVADI